VLAVVADQLVGAPAEKRGRECVSEDERGLVDEEVRGTCRGGRQRSVTRSSVTRLAISHAEMLFEPFVIISE
jgi:hypothetical protein